MINNNEYSKILNIESLHDFVVRLCNDVKCYYHKTDKVHSYSLKKLNSTEHGKMGVFAWVNEKKKTTSFKIDTYHYLAIKGDVAHLADETKDGMHYISKKHDSEGKGTGVSVFVKNGSAGNDYQKAVTLLKAVMKNK